MLKPQAEQEAPAPDAGGEGSKSPRKPRHVTYRPSHKATFIGIGVVVIILAINVGVITFFMRDTSRGGAQTDREAVTLSSDTLDKLGVSRTPVGDLGTELIIGPNSRFNGKVTVGGDVSVAGQLRLNSKFSASDASLAKLEAGDTSLQQLNVNGDGTISTLTLRRDLNVTGSTRLQGQVVVSQLMTVNNSLNVAGNLAVGGVLSARGFQASSLVSDTTLTIGGHIITRGNSPGVSRGGALAGVDTVSISGNDAAGTVAVNIGVGAPRSGIVANIDFRNNYSNTPHVIVTAVGPGVRNLYVNRNAGGFSIGVESIDPGGHAFDFIVMQ